MQLIINAFKLSHNMHPISIHKYSCKFKIYSVNIETITEMNDDEATNIVELDKFSTSVKDVVFSLPGMSMMLSPWHLAVVDMQSPEIQSSSSSRMV